MYSAACENHGRKERIKGRKTESHVEKCFPSRSAGKGDRRAHLGLDVECDQSVSHQVVDGLEPLLAHKVLPVVVQAEVPGLVAEPGSVRRRLCVRTSVDISGYLHFAFSFSFSWDL